METNLLQETCREKLKQGQTKYVHISITYLFFPFSKELDMDSYSLPKNLFIFSSWFNESKNF